MPESFASKAEEIANDLVAELLPEDLDWQQLVRTYPVPALALAALGGFLVARHHGPAIVTAVSGFVAAEVAKNVSSLLGQEVEP
jgi:hypothetical protein